MRFLSCRKRQQHPTPKPTHNMMKKKAKPRAADAADSGGGRLSVNRKAFCEALGLLTPLHEGSLPGYSSVRIVSQSGVFRLSACNGRAEAHTRVGTSGELANEPWATLVSGRKLATIAGGLAGEELEIGYDEKTAVLGVKSGGSHFKLHCRHDVDSFPPGIKPEAQMRIAFAAGKLRQALRHAVWAVSRDNARYVLNGVLLMTGDEGAMVATDGRVMAHVRLGECGDMDGEYILPNESVKYLLGTYLKPLADEDEVVLEIGAKFATWHFGNRDADRYTHALVEGKFPNWRRVMPAEASLGPEIVFQREDLLGRLKLLALLGGEQIRLRLGESGPMQISATHADVGEGNVDLCEVECPPGSKLNVLAKGEYLLALATGIGGEALVLRQGGVLKWTGDEGVTGLLVPLSEAADLDQAGGGGGIAS